jgi:hypothetical protein
VLLRGPRGALALVGLRDRICAAAYRQKQGTGTI